MFIVENIGQTEAFFLKRTLHIHWDKFCKNYPEISHILGSLERGWNPWKLPWKGFTKLKINHHDSVFPFLVLCLIT